MKICFLLLIFCTLNSWAAPSAPGVQLSKIESGEISPFWLEAMTNKKSKAEPDKIIKKKISVQSFFVMTKQVTVHQFKKFLDENPKWKKENASSLMIDESYLNNLDRKDLNESTPMTNVSWFAASAYCEAEGMRLPTTNEWEYIAAASEQQKDASANLKFLKRILEWYGQPQSTNPKSVGSIYKNLYGVWDLHGNVWEWVSDFNSNFITGESREDTSLNKDMFCGAGGLAGGNKENYAAFMRYAFRSSLKGKSSTNNLGFRCVRTL